MRGVHEPPMRSEDDLRAVLAELEHCAPDLDTVLHAVRKGTERRRGPGSLWIMAPWRPRSRRWPRLALVAAAAALAGLVIALVAGVLPAGHGPAQAGHPSVPPPVAQSGLPSAASMGRAMLTAAYGVNGDILYTKQTGFTHGVVVDTYQDWSWPAQPVTGQLERTLEVFSERDPASAPLQLTETDEFNYIVPPGDPNYVKGHLTVVCYPTLGSKEGCGYGNTNTPAGTYSTWDRPFINPNPGLNDLLPSALAKEITRGLWRVTRQGQYEGQPAIELTQTAKGIYRPLPVVLWVNAKTYLPLRMLWGPGTLPSTVVSWSFLRPTKASLALLNARIPAGYPHTGGS
jgi:hypothetical protein